MTSQADSEGRSTRWTLLDALNWTTGFFTKAGVPSPRLDAEMLLASVLQTERIELYMRYDQPLERDEREAYRALVVRRANGEPAQYILGRQGFWSLDLKVGPGVLVPRPDTEVLVEEALTEARRVMEARGQSTLSIADVGTGSGAIALALASELPGAEVWAGDIHDAPLQVAAANAKACHLAQRVRVVRADLLAGLCQVRQAPFDLVVSNPPYIRHDDMPGLMREVRDWEPRSALVGGGADGLAVIGRLVDEVSDQTIHPGGALIVEIGDESQANELSERMVNKGFCGVRVRADYGGNVRAVVGRWRTG